MRLFQLATSVIRVAPTFILTVCISIAASAQEWQLSGGDSHQGNDATTYDLPTYYLAHEPQGIRDVEIPEIARDGKDPAYMTVYSSPESIAYRRGDGRTVRDVESTNGWSDGNTAWGAMYPRIGQEVDGDFSQGDPDQPIIIGYLYNFGSSVRIDPSSIQGSPHQSDDSPPYAGHPRTQPEQEPTWSEEDQELEDSARDDYYETLRRHADDQASIEDVEEAYDELRRYRQ